jgi:hypothetical protein
MGFAYDQTRQLRGHDLGLTKQSPPGDADDTPARSLEGGVPEPIALEGSARPKSTS